MKTSLAVLTCLLGLNGVAHATVDLQKVATDVAAIKAVLPTGSEIAGAYVLGYDTATTITLRTGDEYLNSVAQNYLMADLNKDGFPDLAVAVESAPTKDDTGINFGKRKLLIYLGDAQGKLKLFTQGQAVLNADDGGTFGDPLDGLTLSKTGALVIAHYAGSADRWGLTESFMFMKDDFYKIGETDVAYNDITLKGETVDTNLLTGNQIVTSMSGRRSVPDKTEHKRVPVKALRRLSEVSAEYDLEHSPAQL